MSDDVKSKPVHDSSLLSRAYASLRKKDLGGLKTSEVVRPRNFNDPSRHRSAAVAGLNAAFSFAAKSRRDAERE